MTALSTFQKLLTILILFIIVFFSLFHLSEAPPFQVDEGWTLQVAQNIAQTGVDGLQFSPGELEHVSILTSVGYTLIYSLALWVKVFGTGVFQARIMMIMYLLGFVAVSFVFLRRQYGNVAALSALALLSTFPPFFAFGKRIIGEVPVLFFFILFLLLFNIALAHPKRKSFLLIMAGLAAGLCVITKTMALALIPILVIGAIIAYRRKEIAWKDIGTLTMSALIPFIVWIVVNFQPGDTLTSTLDYYTNPSALTDRTAAFWLNLKLLFTTTGSLFMLSFTGIWIIGIALRIKHKVTVSTEEMVSVLFSLLLIASLLFRYWDARYLFPMQALGILFAPYSLYYILGKLLAKRSGVAKSRYTSPTYAKTFIVVVALLCVLDLYQLSFHSYVADSYKSTYTKDLSEYFGSIPPSTSILFYNTPNIVPFFRGTEYYQRIAMFEKWVLGPEFGPMANEGQVDLLVLEALSKEDEKVSLANYEKVAQIREVSIFKKRSSEDSMQQN